MRNQIPVHDIVFVYCINNRIWVFPSSNRSNCFLRGRYRAGRGLREGDYLKDLDVSERIMFEWIFKRWDGRG